MDPMCRKRNVSDGDSGFDSALSSRSSSISLDQESPEFGKPFFSPDADLLSTKLNSSLRAEYQDILTSDEDIEREDEDLLLITNKITGVETLFKPPTRLKFSSSPPEVATTHSPEDYDRNNSIPRSALFHARLEYELEKQIAKMDLVEVDLVMECGVTPPPSLGIRVIGVNMIHGVPDKLNIYVKRIVEDSVAGCDGRILVNDHIVEVNGISLVGVSQKLASQTLSNCAICPETGTVHFVLARPAKDAVESAEQPEEGGGAPHPVAPEATEGGGAPRPRPVAPEATALGEAVKDSAVTENGCAGVTRGFTQSPDSFLKAQAEPDFVGRDAVRLIGKVGEKARSGDAALVARRAEVLRGMLRLSKLTVLVVTAALVSVVFVAVARPKRKSI